MVSSGEKHSNGGQGGGSQQNRGHTVHTVNKSHDSSQLDIPSPHAGAVLRDKSGCEKDTKAGRRPCKGSEPGYRNHLPV